MNKKFIITVITLLALNIGVLLMASSKIFAQSESFHNVIPFFTSSRMGFFNQNSGKIYIYDNNLENCLFVGHLQELGEPIVKDVENTPEAVKKYTAPSVK